MSNPRKNRPLLEVTDQELDDLRSRLRGTRWATPWPVEPWQAGTDPDELRRLVSYWADGYDWRAQEAAINALPSAFAEIDGLSLHYLHFEAERPGAQPILLINGWPSSFLELTGLAQRLSSPSQFGGSAQDAFTVIVPSLPGFGFSDQRPSLGQAPLTHDLLHTLMHDVLGFEKYAVHGSDLAPGSPAGWPRPIRKLSSVCTCSTWTRLRATTTPTSPPKMATSSRPSRPGSPPRRLRPSAQHPPTDAGPGLSDSPAGLLAWILEKYRAWSDSDGDASAHFGDDVLLTQASLYWFTNAISTSFRPYYERWHQIEPRLKRVEVPTALAFSRPTSAPRHRAAGSSAATT